jgi:aminoglycoside phosphotransferase (APT) family kinase protein
MQHRSWMSVSESSTQGLDTAALLAWLEPRLPEISGPLSLARVHGGQSNPTYVLSSPGGRWILRRKPGGPLLPSAHQIEREYRVLRALEPTAVPVPRALTICDDETVIGAPFYIMQFLDGRVFSDPSLPALAAPERAAIYDAASATLAELHRVDYRAAGLADYGRSEGYLTRQVARWTKQYLASQTEAIPSMDALIAWLPQHLPVDDEVTIAHGDFRLGNLMFHPTEPRVIGVLDWELSTIGHPLLDLAYAALSHYTPLEVTRLMGGTAELSTVEGIPSSDAFIDAYCRYAQRARPTEFPFYLALAFFRSAAIMQGIRQRIALGNAAGGREAELRAAVAPLLADLGWSVAQGSG